MSRFQLAHVSDSVADVFDEREMKVASIGLVRGEESLWINADFGRLTIADLEALAELMARRARDRSYES